MSEEFNWKQFLKTEENLSPAVQEGAIVDPRTGVMIHQPYEKKDGEDKINIHASQTLADQ